MTLYFIESNIIEFASEARKDEAYFLLETSESYIEETQFEYKGKMWIEWSHVEGHFQLLNVLSHPLNIPSWLFPAIIKVLLTSYRSWGHSSG